MFKDVMISEKKIEADVNLERQSTFHLSHMLQILELISSLYPEVKKVKKLLEVITTDQNATFIPKQIKIPVVSSLGIKAVVQIGEINDTPFSSEEHETIFGDFGPDYHVISESRESEANDRTQMMVFESPPHHEGEE